MEKSKATSIKQTDPSGALEVERERSIKGGMMKTFSIVVAALSLLASGPVLSERMKGELHEYVLCGYEYWTIDYDCGFANESGLLLVPCSLSADVCCNNKGAKSVIRKHYVGPHKVQEAGKAGCIWPPV